MDATVRSAAGGFFTAPSCLFSPSDLEREFSISKTSAIKRAAAGAQQQEQGDADDNDDEGMERLMTQTTISSFHGDGGAEDDEVGGPPPSPLSSDTLNLDGLDLGRRTGGKKRPMYTSPVVSACTASKDGAFVAAVAGYLLIVWRWTGKGWRRDVRAKLPEKVKYMSVAFLRSNLEVVVAGSDGTAYAVQRANGHPITSMQHVQQPPPQPLLEGGTAMVEEQHASYYIINSMKVSAKENFLATCAGDARTIIWDTASKLPLLVTKFVAPKQPENWRLAPRKAALIRPETFAVLEEPIRHVDDAVYDCDMSQDELWLASGGEGEVIDLWSMTNIRPVQESEWVAETRTTPDKRLMRGHEARISALTFSPSGTTLASADVKGFVVLWNVEMGTGLLRLQSHRMAVTRLVFVPQDDDSLITCGLDSLIRVWRLRAGMARTSADVHIMQDEEDNAGPVIHTSKREPDLSLRGHDSGITQLCCFRRGGFKKRAVGATGNLSASLSPSNYSATSTQHNDEGSDSSSGLYLLSAGVDQRVWVWGLGGDTLQQQRRAVALPIHVYYRGKQPNETAISHAALSCGSSRLATTRYQDIRIFVWDMDGDKGGHLCQVLNGHQRSIMCLSFATRDEAMLAAGGESGRVCIWRLRSQDSYSAPPQSSSTTMYTQANLPWLKGMGGDPQDTPPGMVERRSGFLEPECVWNDHASGIRSVSFAEDDLHLVSCDTVSHIRVMNIASREVVYTITGGDPVMGPVRFIQEGTTTTSANGGDDCKTPEGIGSRPASSAVKAFVMSTSTAEVLVWEAASGQVHSRHALADDEQDALTDMDCYYSHHDHRDATIYICACTLAGNLSVWAVPVSDPSKSSQWWLEVSGGSSTTGIPFRGIAFHDRTCNRVVAWGLSVVAAWDRVEEKEGGGQEEASEGLRSGTMSPAAFSPLAAASSGLFSHDNDHLSLKGRGSIREPATVSTDSSAVRGYELAMFKQVGEAEFMKGCCLARQVATDGTIRLVLKEGWVIDRGGRPSGNQHITASLR